LHGAGGRENAGFTDGSVVGEDLDVAAHVGATESQPQSGFAMRCFGRVEGD
jgi:hypothetical protein